MNDIIEKKARLTMSLRAQAILSSPVLSAIETIPREIFIDSALKQHAYENASLPIACGQTISQPYIVAKMTETLEITSRHTVLEIGTGSGYQAAILSLLARRVYSLERHRPLFVEARNRLADLKLTNITLRLGDGFSGWPEAAPFDKIIFTCQVEHVPDAIIQQLKPDGILIAPIGSPGKEFLTKLTKKGDVIHSEKLISVRFVPMVPGIEHV